MFDLVTLSFGDGLHTFSIDIAIFVKKLQLI